MRKIVVTKKTGFQITDPSTPVIIRDNRSILFYSTEPYGGRIKQFNLPDFGTYWVESGSFQPLNSPIIYKYASLPDLERVHKSPFNFKVEFGVNKNKATIMWFDETILIDNAFQEKPLPEVFFILYHEFAHAFHVPEEIANLEAAKLNMTVYAYQESIADQLSGNYMKAKGFNPEQIGSAPITALSEKQYQRKVNMVESILQAQ